MPKKITEQQLNVFIEKKNQILNNITNIIYDQDEKVKIILAVLFAGGHILLEDMPGTGKTTLARLLAMSIKSDKPDSIFKRIQFTPDLLPMDITGANIYDQNKNAFTFHPGPVFSHLLLADELNRAAPKVQSALLQCMAEGTVTVENQTYELKKPFFVIATQNPLETEGTYPLPIAQLDRFFAKISLTDISRETHKKILQDYRKITSFENVKAVITLEEIEKYRSLMDDVHVEDSLLDLIVSIIFETKAHKDLIRTGASPRASIIFLKLVKSWAMLNDRDYVIDQDIKDMAIPCLKHRLQFNFIDSENEAMDSIINNCLNAHLRAG